MLRNVFVGLVVLAATQFAAAQVPPDFPSTVTKGTTFDHYLSGGAADVSRTTEGGLLLATRHSVVAFERLAEQ